jgi:hypothetical protein
MDRAIDEVARRLVRAASDPGMASRIVARLPERRRSRWASQPAWMVHAVGAASLAAVLMALWLPGEPSPAERDDAAARARLEGSRRSASPEPGRAIEGSSRTQPAQAPSAGVPLSARRERGRTAAIRVRGSAVTDPSRRDHDRALAPVDDVAAISLIEIETRAIDLEPVSLAPLTLDALVDGGALPASKEP